MNHQEKLLEIYENSFKIDDVELPETLMSPLNVVLDKIESQKGVYTVLITLGIHKLLYPSQDIRFHQDNMDGGFSGRSIDTKYITPTLKQLGLTSMSESGWLTRSLEQPYPYDEKYLGKISKVKNEFLTIVDFIENQPEYTTSIIRKILNESINLRKRNQVDVKPISNPDSITIEKIILSLEEFFGKNYHISGGSKLPVLSFYSIYEILIDELKRYENCQLGVLGSHTSSDRTSKSSGDIEIFNDGELVESLEIKFDIEIDNHIVNRVIPKIHIHNPKRYYILSTSGIKEDEYSEVISKVYKLKEEHGCQLIINGLIPTLKYYLRLINNLEDFVEKFTHNVLTDKELKLTHKEKWEEIYSKNFN